MPTIYTTSSPSNEDVLCGRGGRINAHAGNVTFRQLVSEKKSVYLAPTTRKMEKATIAASIVDQIYSNGGHFLKESEDSVGLWFDIGYEKAKKKAGQALREDAPDFRKQLEEPNTPPLQQVEAPFAVPAKIEMPAPSVAENNKIFGSRRTTVRSSSGSQSMDLSNISSQSINYDSFRSYDPQMLRGLSGLSGDQVIGAPSVNPKHFTSQNSNDSDMFLEEALMKQRGGLNNFSRRRSFTDDASFKNQLTSIRSTSGEMSGSYSIPVMIKNSATNCSVMTENSLFMDIDDDCYSSQREIFTNGLDDASITLLQRRASSSFVTSYRYNEPSSNNNLTGNGESNLNNLPPPIGSIDSLFQTDSVPSLGQASRQPSFLRRQSASMRLSSGSVSVSNNPRGSGNSVQLQPRISFSNPAKFFDSTRNMSMMLDDDEDDFSSSIRNVDALDLCTSTFD